MFRKYLVVLLFIAGLAPPEVSAQLEGLGVKFGFNFVTPISKPVEGATLNPGFNGLNGFFLRFRLAEKFTIQSGIQLSLKASEFTTPISGDTIVEQFIPNVGYIPFAADYAGIVYGRFRNYYAEVPVAVRFETSEHWAVVGGIYGAYLLRPDNSGTADIELGDGFDFREGELFDQTADLHPWDYGVLFGGEYRRNNWQVDLRATIGLRTIYDRDFGAVSSSVWNGYIQGTFGYFFEINKD